MNPFATSMVKLYLPPHLGEEVSVRGFTLPVDANRCVDVPKDVAADLVGHGLMAIPPNKDPAEFAIEQLDAMSKAAAAAERARKRAEAA